MTDEELLAVLEDLIRTMPAKTVFANETEDALVWEGRAMAAVKSWDLMESVSMSSAIMSLHNSLQIQHDKGYRELFTLMHQARADLRMKTVGPTSVAVSGSMPYDYFDEIRKVIELANSDILFIDPYLDAEFVSRYLPHIKDGVPIRLLASKRLNTLRPAVQTFVQQHSVTIEVRSEPNIHDRFVFIDKRECYFSGASFKDGGKKSPAIISQITDAFAAVHQIYQDKWDNAQVEP